LIGRDSPGLPRLPQRSVDLHKESSESPLGFPPGLEVGVLLLVLSFVFEEDLSKESPLLFFVQDEAELRQRAEVLRV